MIVFSAIVPHSPLLLPDIGKTHVKKLAQTVAALADIEQRLYVTRPDTICVISPHGQVLGDAFGINLSAQYATSFKDFGDFKTAKTFRSDFLLIDRIQRSIRKDIPLALHSDETLDYGFGVPLHLLTEHLANPTIIPVTTSGLDLKAHFEFGKAMRDEMLNSNKRVAVIASADLAHSLTKDAPGGFSPRGAEFDAKIQELLAHRNVPGLLQMDPTLCAEAKECGLRAILIALGLLDGIDYTARVLSYEGPLGIGYLVSHLQFS
ncbi:MAG: class III extradiol dioxygenase subunit B-like domain-containing protein [Patescibacteria group bacterium]